MYKIKLASFVLLILLGGFMVVYGEMDDSPGGQFLGLVAIVVGIMGIVKSRKLN